MCSEEVSGDSGKPARQEPDRRPRKLRVRAERAIDPLLIQRKENDIVGRGDRFRMPAIDRGAQLVRRRLQHPGKGSRIARDRLVRSRRGCCHRDEEQNRGRHNEGESRPWPFHGTSATPRSRFWHRGGRKEVDLFRFFG